MQIKHIGTRGHLAVFESAEIGVDTSTVYVIDGDRRWYVIDTFLGPEAIAEIKASLAIDFSDKPVIVVNSHAHYDHFWGNCAFEGATIVAHILCRQGIARKEQLDYLAQLACWQRGEVTLVAPNVTFDRRLVFEDDGVELFHSPGHTQDSISCIDRVDQVLLVGDAIGLPIPSIYPGVGVEDFIATLETYQALALPVVVSGHYGVIGKDLIESNLRYLRKLLAHDTAEYEQGDCANVHNWNVHILERKAPQS